MLTPWESGWQIFNGETHYYCQLEMYSIMGKLRKASFPMCA